MVYCPCAIIFSPHLLFRLADKDSLAVHVVAVYENDLSGRKRAAAVQRISVLVAPVPFICPGVHIGGLTGDVHHADPE